MRSRRPEPSPLRRGLAVLLSIGLLSAGLAGMAVSPAAAAPTASADCGSNDTPAVVALHNPRFYVDTSLTPALRSQYAGYSVRAGAQARSGLWLELTDFSGSTVALAPGQPARQALPDLSSGASSAQYLLLQASGLTTAPQSHSVKLWQGVPGGGTLLCTRTFTYSGVFDTIKALANKVTGITADLPSGPASIGDAVTITVTGNTGTVGAGPAADPGVLDYTPTALEGFPAGGWRLERTELVIPPPGGGAPVTHVDRLYLTGASGAAREYTVRYRFRAIGPAASSVVKPIQYIASGTQVKHTDVGGATLYALPEVSPIAKVTLDKRLVSPSTGRLPSGGGRASYALELRNDAGAPASVDAVRDQLPAGGAYVAGTLRRDGRALTPRVAAGVLTVDGPVRVPANGTTTFTYDVDLDGTPGLRRNAATADFGTVELDASADVGSTDPAVAVVTVLDSAALTLAPASATTPAGTPVVVQVLEDDATGPSGLTLQITEVGVPTSGRAVLGVGGAITYSPAAATSGTATFTYTATDGNVTGTGTVTVVVTPVAADDAYATPVGKPLLVEATGVLANDVCTGCTVALTTGLTRTSGTVTGTLSLEQAGGFLFTPSATGTGTFTFGYTAGAGAATTSATVTLSVTNLGPDHYTTPHATQFTGNVSANDVCQGACNPSAGDVAPTRGVATYTNGNPKLLQYTPTSGLWGIDVFSYSTGGNAPGNAPVTVLVGPPTTTLSTTFGEAVTGQPAGDLSCPGCRYALAVPPTRGTATVDPATAALTYVPGPNGAGTDSFTFTTRHPTTGLTIPGTVHVTVGPRAVDDAASVLLGGSFSVDTAANDTCPAPCTRTLLPGAPPGAALTDDGTLTWTPATIGVFTARYRLVSGASGTVASEATVTLTVTGAVDDEAETDVDAPVVVDVLGNDPCTGCALSSVTAPAAGTAIVESGKVRYTPRAGFSGVDAFTYTSTSGGASTSAAVRVTVRPRAVPDSAVTLRDRPVELRVLDNDLCGDCRVVSVTTADHGVAAMGGGGAFVRFEPPSDWTGRASFAYELADQDGERATTTVTVSVVAPPTPQDDVAVTDPGVAVEVDVLHNDGCTGCAIEVATDPTGGSVSLGAYGGLRFSPPPATTGRFSFRYLVTDPATGGEASAQVTVDVRPLAAPDRAATPIDEHVDVPVLANDVCTGCTRTVVAASDGATAAFLGDGLLRITPGVGFTGPLTVQYELTDPVTSLSATASVDVLVDDALPDQVATAHHTPTTVDVLANDVCVDCRVLTVTPPATFTGPFVTYLPPVQVAGLVDLAYTAGDGDGRTVGSSLRVLVAPPLRTTAVPSTGVATGVVHDATATTPATTCGGCVVTLTTPPIDGEVELGADGSFTYWAADGWSGEEAITYALTDPSTGLVVAGVHRFATSTAAPSISLTTTAGAVARSVVEPADRVDAGDTVELTHVVTNTGGAPLDGITVTADRGGPVTCAAGTLPVAASRSCSSTLTLSQADVDAGEVAVTTGAEATAGDARVVDDSAAIVPLVRDSGLSVTGSGVLRAEVVEPDEGADAGDEVDLTWTITNTGNTTLTAPTVDGVACVPATLAPGALATCARTVVLTADDVEEGSFAAPGVVAASSPTGPVPGAAPVSVELPGTSTVAAITVTTVLTVDPTVTGTPEGAEAGDTVQVVHILTNTGEVDLASVNATDALTALTCAASTLAPGMTTTCAGSRALTADDVTGGSVTSFVTANGSASGGRTAQATRTTHAALPRPAARSLAVQATTAVGSAVTAPPSRVDAGDRVGVAYVVTNTGELPVSDLALTDVAAGPVTCPAGPLAAGDSLSCSASVLLDQAVVDAGRLTGTGTATGTAGGSPVTAAATWEAALPAAPGLELDKTVTTGGAQGCAAATASVSAPVGTTVTFCFAFRNTGNVTLDGLVVVDPALDLGPSEGSTRLVSSTGRLVPGAVAVRAADAVAGSSLVNSAHGEAVTPDTRRVTSPVSTATLTVPSAPPSSPGPEPTSPVSTADPTPTTQPDPTAAPTPTTQPDPTPTAAPTPAAPSPAPPATAPSVTPAPSPGPAPVSRAAVEGVVWFDRNGDGRFGPGEWPLPGVTVTLSATDVPAGLLRAALALSRTQVTGPDGGYAFRDLPAGSYRLRAAVDLRGFAPTSDSDGDDDWVVDLQVAAAGSGRADFAGLGHGELGGQVFEASSAAAVPGAVVRCTWAGYDDVFGTADDVVMLDSVDADGRFALLGVPYGQFSCVGEDPVTGRTSPAAALEVLSADAVEAELPLESSAAGAAAEPVLGHAPHEVVGVAPAPSATRLPRTGADAGRLLALAAGLVAAGLLLLTGGRRRRA